MAEQTNRKGGRSWWGKAEAKATGRVTRRRDDKIATWSEYQRRYFPREVDAEEIEEQFEGFPVKVVERLEQWDEIERIEDRRNGRLRRDDKIEEEETDAEHH